MDVCIYKYMVYIYVYMYLCWYVYIWTGCNVHVMYLCMNFGVERGREMG